MQQLHVEVAALRALATRWGSSARELTETTTPTAQSLSLSQPSATAVAVAHADIGFFTAALAARIDMRARHVADAEANYVAREAQSADEVAAVAM